MDSLIPCDHILPRHVRNSLVWLRCEQIFEPADDSKNFAACCRCLGWNVECEDHCFVFAWYSLGSKGLHALPAGNKICQIFLSARKLFPRGVKVKQLN